MAGQTGWGPEPAAGSEAQGGAQPPMVPPRPPAPPGSQSFGGAPSPGPYGHVPQGHVAPNPYGAPFAAAYGGFAPPTQNGKGLQIASLVCGISALVLFLIPFFTWILGPLGIIFGGIGISQARKVGASRGMGIAGIVCGSLGLAGWIFLVISVIVSCSENGC